MLEYLPGFNLSRLAEMAPRNTWQDVCDEAIRIVHTYSSYGVLNRDVRPENFIVGDTHPHRVVLIDLARCQLRSQQESDAAWDRRKWRQDEEAAIGLVMKLKLAQEANFELEYEPSLKYLEWAPGEDD